MIPVPAVFAIGTIEASLVAATTTDLASLDEGTLRLTASSPVTVNSFGTGVNQYKVVQFDANITLTHSSALQLNDSVNRTTLLNDLGIFLSDASGNWREVHWQDATWKPWDWATQAEAEAGTLDDVVMSPLRTKQLHEALLTTGNLISFNVYESSQTITIPADVSRGLFWLWGSGGGQDSSTAPGGGGGGGVVKWLTGLTPGNTLSFTRGAGVTGNSHGNASTLASGTQSITTLTASGGQKSGAGGAATNGDLNITGGWGSVNVAGVSGSDGRGGGPGGKGFGLSTGGSSSDPGGMIVFWFS